MSVSCSCSFEEGTTTVGDPRNVVCRTPRKCSACEQPITYGDQMYMWSMYDWDECRAISPIFLCEECGDMALNLMSVGFCFNVNEGIREQWIDYLHDTDPNNPAFRNAIMVRRDQ